MRLAIDTGGTFTDIVLSDELGQLYVEKALTNVRRPYSGIEKGLEKLATRRKQTVEELLSGVELLIYGTTTATNAIVTRNAAKTALLATTGFADILTLKEGGKADPFDWSKEYPKPYIPRRLTFEISERISSQGEVVTPISEEEVRQILRQVDSLDVEAIAVSLLWSIAQGIHESQVGRLIEEELPGMPYTLSHQLNPIIREYRRTSGTAIDASLKPLMQEHFGRMQEDFESAGFQGSLLGVTCMAGAQLISELSDRPIYSVNSGPAMAPVGASKYISADSDALICDVGGTTSDVSILKRGAPVMTGDTWLGEPFQGDITGLSSVDVRSVGAGGGSIAYVDVGGMLKIGPQSAGSDPGPACYGMGGTKPTVSDAAAVLGYFDPDYFLGGQMPLDLEAARNAISRAVAEPLGIDADQAAHAIFKLATTQMATLLRDFVMYHGVDPARATLIPCGGAGGMLATNLADALGSDAVLVPRTASALSAMGGLFADIVREYSVSEFLSTKHGEVDLENGPIPKLGLLKDAFATEVEAYTIRSESELKVEARYPSQVSELEVSLGLTENSSDLSAEYIETVFGDEHERLFGVRQDDLGVECINWKVRCRGILPGNDSPSFADDVNMAAAEAKVVQSYFDGEYWETPRLRPEQLRISQQIVGPACIDETTTVVVVPPGWSLNVESEATYRLTRLEEKA